MPANATPAPTVPPATWHGDLSGAFNAAATSFAVAIGGGVLIFAPLGAQWIPYGILASLVATAAGNLAASLLSSTPVAVSSPRAAACLVLAAFVATLHRAIPEVPPTGVIAVTGLVVMLAGLVQVVAGALQLGRLIRYVPFPVVAGFTHGIALSLLLVFVPLLLGLAEVPRIALPRPDTWHWAAPLVGAAALAAIVLTGRLGPRLPAIFVGMIAGVAVHLALRAVLPAADAGPFVRPGAVPPLLPPFFAWEAVTHVMRDPIGPRLVASFVLALAAVASIDAMVGSMAIETRYLLRSRPDRDLVAQGVGNLVSGAIGGAAIAYSVVAVQAARSAGATGPWVSPMVSACVAAIAVGFALLVESVPLAVLAALMIVIAFRLADPWGVALVKRVAGRGAAPDAVARESFIVYALVALAIVALDIVAALAVGLVASAVIFIRTMNQHVVRAVATGADIRSRRLYPPDVTPLLAEAMRSVAVVELGGPLFFGTADRIGAAVAELPAGVRYVVLDLGRVQALDATAGAVLARTHARLRKEGRILLLAGGPAALAGLGAGLPAGFPDSDHAIEWVEGRLLEEAGARAEGAAMEPAALAGLLGLPGDEGRQLLAIATVSDFRAGDTVFTEGDPGDDLCFVLSGRVSIYLSAGGQKGPRVVTYLPGNTFGDVAFLDGRPRTASAIADSDCRVLRLSRAAIDGLATRAPGAVAHFYASLALAIAGRMRNSTRLLRDGLKS